MGHSRKPGGPNLGADGTADSAKKQTQTAQQKPHMSATGRLSLIVAMTMSLPTFGLVNAATSDAATTHTATATAQTVAAHASAVKTTVTKEASTSSACGNTGVYSVSGTASCLYTTPGSDTFTAPAYVSQVTFDVVGAGGLWTGKPGEAKGTLAVTAGETFAVTVGGEATGSNPNPGSSYDPCNLGGFNGGGAAGGNSNPGGCAGAGASDVRSSGAALADRLLIGGGGGGDVLDNLGNIYAQGGSGGGLTGTNGQNAPCSGCGSGGGAGTQSAAGASPGTASSAGYGFGGKGGPAVTDLATGGAGGGGGYYGGGASGGDFLYPGAGAGGSGYVTSQATSTSLATGVVNPFAAQAGGGLSGYQGAIEVTWAAAPISSTVTMTSDQANPVPYATPVNLTVTATTSTGVPEEGVVIITDYSKGNGASSPSAPGNCPCQNVAQGYLDNGTFTDTVRSSSLFFGPDHDFVATVEDYYGQLPDAKSPGVTVNFQPMPQTITFTSTPPTGAKAYETYGVSATASSGLPVAFSIAPQSSSVCTLSGSTVSSSTVSFNAAGSCIILADQVGNASYYPAAEIDQDLTVAPGTPQTITFTSTAPTNPAPPGTYSVTATGGGSGNPVTFSTKPGDDCTVSQGKVSFTLGGTCVIYADQAGGNGYAPATEATQSFTIQPASQAIHLTTTPPTVAQVNGTYTVSGYADSGAPLTFTADAAGIGCTVTNPVVANPGLGYYVTSATVTYTAIGACIVDANQPGQLPSYAAAPQVQQTMQVIGLPQAITFTSTVPANAVYGGTYTPTTTGGASGNPVTLSTTTPSVCTVANGVVSLVGVGTCAVDADQAASTTYSAAPEVSQTFSVTPAVLMVTPASESKTYGAADPQFAFTISGFQNKDTATALSSQPVCTVGVPHTGAGTYTITCSAASATNYTFTYNTAVLTVNRAPLTVTANNATRQYGVTNPTLGATISGFVYGQTLTTSGVTGAPACTTTATTTSAPGAYPITCSAGTLSSTDYAFGTFTAGTLTVVPAATTLVVARPTFGLLAINLSATLTGTVTGAPIAGQTVAFSIFGNRVCSGVTNAHGVAACTALGLIIGPLTYTATYSGGPDYLASTNTATF